MGCLAKAVGLLILASWTGGGVWLLVEQKAHGESLLPAIIVLGLAVLVIAALTVAALVDRIPAWRHGRGGAMPAIVTIGLAVISTVGIWLVVDMTVVNRRPSAELTAALAPACAGQPVAGAARLSTTVANHLVVLALDGTEHSWTGFPSIGLRPPSLSDAELVVCVDPVETRTQIQVCKYVNGPDITRWAVSRKVEVHEAATGRLIISFTASADARGCKQTEQQEVVELVGVLEWSQVESRLEYLVAHGVDGSTRITASRPIILAPGESDVIGLVVTNTTSDLLTATLQIRYPATGGGAGLEELLVSNLEPGERRIDGVRPVDLAPESSVGITVEVAKVEAGSLDAASRATRRQVTVTAPAVPVAEGDAVEVTLTNASSMKLFASITVGFLRAGVLVAIGQGSVKAIAAGDSATLELDLTGDASGADEVLSQVDVAYEVR